MKRLVLLSLLLFPIFLFAQYPTFSNKQRLGVQTTGDGLIFRGTTVNNIPNYTPSNVNNAYFHLDTIANKLYLYNGGWQQVYPAPQFDTTTLNVYLKISDTTAMLLPYFRDSDTTQLNLINRFALKLNISDTSVMLSPYLRKADTISLSNRINLKFNTSDTTILSNRITTNANNIITINTKLDTKLDTIYVKFKNVVTRVLNKDTINIGSSLIDGYAINIIGDSINIDTTILDIRYPDRDSTNELQDITFATTSGVVTISGGKVMNLDTLYNSVIDSVKNLIQDSIAAFIPVTEGYGINIIGDSINIDTTIIFTQSDTITLSNRIDLKLNTSDTISLSNRINTKLDTIYVQYPTYLDTITNKETITIPKDLTEGFGINIIADSINIDSAVILTTQQKQIAYVKNQSGATMYKGQAVYSSGSTGDNKLVLLASSSTEQTSSKTFGVVESDSIPNGTQGYIITFGLLSGFNTNGLTEGSSVYLSTTPGQLTTTKPQAPLHLVTIGVCIRQQQNNGSIFVKIQNGFEFDELHDVRLTDLVDKASIYYNSSEDLWRDTTAALLVSDTATMLNPYLRKLDTLSLSNRINLKFNTADTSILGYVTTYSNQLNINGNKTFNNTVSVDSLNATKQAKIQSLTVGKGGYAIIGGTPGGISSTAFGFEALKNNTIGDWNTAIGYQALLNNDTAWNNVAIGNNALRFNTVGEYNTAIGVDALNLNIVGNYNTAIGYSSGNGSKGSNNIFIGSNSGHLDSVNNVLVIGSAASPLLTGILSGNKKLGININPLNITSTFQVNSPISDAVKISSNTNSTNLELANNSGNSVFIKSTNRNMVLQTDTTALMYLNGENNKVGILTMNPEQALEVNGTIRVDSLINSLTPDKLVGANNANDLTDIKIGNGLSFSNDTLKVADNIINSGDTATLLRKDFLGINTNVLVWTEGNKKLLPYFTQVYRNGQLLKSDSQYTITSDSIVTLEEGSYRLEDNITIIAIDNIVALAGSGGIITLQGDVTGSSSTNTITTTIGTSKVTNTMLAGSISNDKLNTITATNKVSNSATTATDANTANHIVLRNASGNFSAGTITASLNGNANTATTLATGRTITITGDLTYTSPSFNGSTNVTAVGTLVNSGVIANTYTAATVTVDAKGRVTSALSNTIPTVNNGTLTMAVSGNGLTGSQTFTANQSSAATFTVTSNATNANTPSTIVYRDASGNFSAGNITASNFLGNATSSTNSTNTTNVLNYLNSNEIFKFRSTNATNVTGQILITTPGTDFSVARIDAAQTFTGTQTFSSTIIGSISGNAATVTTNANLTGDVISTGNATSIATGVIVNADINASAAIAVSKLAASTISGVTLGNNLNTLTISSPLTGTSYNGSSAVSIGIQAATTSVAGSMSAADKTKLDGIASGATANTGTVTNVGGTGTVSGLTLTGSVTTSGNLTLGGTLSLTIENITTALGYTPYNSTNPNNYINRTGLSFVAGSGAYNNTTGVITIPTNNNQITNGAGYITSSALSPYAPLANPTFTGTVSGITKSMVGLGNVDNTSDANKPVSTATQTALNLKQNTLTNPVTGTGTINYIPKFTATGSTIGNSTLIDNGTTISTASILSTTNYASFNSTQVMSTTSGLLSTHRFTSANANGIYDKDYFLTSYMGAPWQGSDPGSGNRSKPPIVAIINNNDPSFINSGLHLMTTNSTNNTYTPAITFGVNSENGSYYNTIGAITAKKLNTGQFTSQSAGQLEFFGTGTSADVTGASMTTANMTLGVGVGIGYTTAPTVRGRLIVSERIGIGNPSPTNTLDVTGTFRATGAATLSSTLTVNSLVTLSSNLILSGSYSSTNKLLGKNSSDGVGNITVGSGLNLTSDVLNVSSKITDINTSQYTITSTDVYIDNFNNSSTQIILPLAGLNTYRELKFKNSSTGALIANGNIIPLSGSGTTTTILPATNAKWCTLVSDGAFWRIMQSN